MDNATYSDDLNSDPILAEALQCVQDVMSEAAATSRIAKLWIQYYHQIMRRFIRAERNGDWTLNIETVREIIPHFHAAGHIVAYRPLSRRLDRCDRVIQKESGDPNGGNMCSFSWATGTSRVRHNADYVP